MRLDKLKRNQLFEAIKEAGLDPGDFKLDDNPSSDLKTRLVHQESEAHFSIGGGSSRYTGDQRVGGGMPLEYVSYSWNSVLTGIGLWLKEVKLDIETPDLWAELEREREMFSAGPADAVENTPFTAKEQAEISGQLREMTEYAKKNYELSQTQALALEAKLDYLEEAAGRLGRLDWRAAAVGTLLSLAFEAILPPEESRHILLILFQSLGHLFGHLIPELPSGY